MKLLSFLFCCLFTGSLYAQQPSIAIAEKYTADSLNRYVNNSMISPVWIDNSPLFYYTSSTDSSTIYYLVNAAKGKKTVLFNSGTLAQKLAALTGEKVNGKELRVTPVIQHTQPDLVKFRYRNKNFEYHVQKETLKETAPDAEVKKAFTSSPSAPYWKKFSYDSIWYVYGYRHDIYLQRSAGKDSFRLTNDGEPYYSFVSSNANNTDDKKYSPMVYWIQDSWKMIALREDKRKVGEMTLINSLAKPRPEAVTYKFPVPGDKNVVQYELFLFDAATQSAKKIDIAKYPDQKIILQSTLVNGRTQLYAGQTGKSGKYVYFLRKSRTNDQLDLCRLDTETGTLTELISETCKPHFNDQLFACHILNNGEDILWWSERTGYGKYYLYDKNGRLKSIPQTGSYVSGEIHRIDTAARSFIFEAYGFDTTIDPSYRMYCSMNFNGTGLTLLTPGNGYHDIGLSPDNKYLTDTYSRMDAAPVHVLRNNKGKQIMELDRADINALLATGWQMPELIKIKAADGITDLYGVFYKPFNLDSTKKYPVISNVYPGPQDDQLPRKFTIDDNYNQSLAQLGYIVVTVGYRGSSPLRGRDFHCFGYGNLRDYALADDKYALEELATGHSYMDLDKVGIYGHSGGGFMSATALLTYPDFYKVAIAASGNYDVNIYTQWWGETYQGIQLTDRGFESKIPVTAELAANLKGKLLLITGDMDRNVHPAQTFRLADALIKNNKRFDMMILPGKDHGLGDKYYVNLIRYYFLEHLR